MKIVDVEPVIEALRDWNNTLFDDEDSAVTDEQYQQGTMDTYDCVMNLLNSQPEISEPVEKVWNPRKEFIKVHKSYGGTPISISRDKIECVTPGDTTGTCIVGLVSGGFYKLKESYEEVMKLLEGEK